MTSARNVCSVSNEALDNFAVDIYVSPGYDATTILVVASTLKFSSTSSRRTQR